MPDKIKEGDSVRDADGNVGTVVSVDGAHAHVTRRDIDGQVWWSCAVRTAIKISNPAPSRLPEEVRGAVERIDRTMQAGGVTTIEPHTPIYARYGGHLLRTEVTTERINAAGEVTYSDTVHRPAPPPWNRWPYTMSSGTLTFSGNPSITLAGNFTPSVDTTTVLPIGELASKRVVATGIKVERTLPTPERHVPIRKPYDRVEPPSRPPTNPDESDEPETDRAKILKESMKEAGGI